MASLKGFIINLLIIIMREFILVSEIVDRKASRLEIISEQAKQNSIFVLFFTTLIFIFFIVMLQLIPEWQVAKFEINDSTVVAQLENSYRTTLAQIIGGFALLLGLYFTWRNSVTAKESQITDRFTRAIDHLGNKNLEIRLGGIYALERISSQSKKDHYPIMEILTTYVRKYSPVESESIKIEDFKNQNKISLDIQAILTVIGRRKYTFLYGEPLCLDLERTNLQEADLRFANLQSTYLSKVNLKGANFKGADLEYADLEYADLRKASFRWTNLKRASLIGANLENAFFKGANLEGANFKGANLEGANFEWTNLKGALNLSIEQLSKVKTLSNTKLDLKLLKQLKKDYPDLFEEPQESNGRFWENFY